MGELCPFNKPVIQTAIPFLIGTKYDIFATFPPDEQEEITKQVRIFSGLNLYFLLIL